MLEKVANSNWVHDFQKPEGYYVLSASDLDTINREAKGAQDLAWSLQIAAQWLKNHGHPVLCTQRSKDNTAWLALCKS